MDVSIQYNRILHQRLALVLATSHFHVPPMCIYNFTWTKTLPLSSHHSCVIVAVLVITLTEGSSSSKPAPASMEKGNCSNSESKERKKGGRRGKGVKLSTDPQSVVARERRQRIGEKFKILQKMVPGGTKMDTASMLDEAIEYVKFLKTQIWLHEVIHGIDDLPSTSFGSSSKRTVTGVHHGSSLFSRPQRAMNTVHNGSSSSLCNFKRTTNDMHGGSSLFSHPGDQRAMKDIPVNGHSIFSSSPPYGDLNNVHNGFSMFSSSSSQRTVNNIHSEPHVFYYCSPKRAMNEIHDGSSLFSDSGPQQAMNDIHDGYSLIFHSTSQQAMNAIHNQSTSLSSLSESQQVMNDIFNDPYLSFLSNSTFKQSLISPTPLPSEPQLPPLPDSCFQGNEMDVFSHVPSSFQSDETSMFSHIPSCSQGDEAAMLSNIPSCFRNDETAMFPLSRYE